MAAPGIGVGDLVLACQTIVELCQRYWDAPDEYDELSSKAWSLEVTLQRIKAENLYEGSIVKRTDNPAEAQVQSILQPLYSDLKELKRIVTKYATIHADGYGRRLLFAFTQSGDLADLRRKIGLHEQALQLWYMTVIVSSLRRIEGGVEGLREILNAMRNWSSREERKIREQVAKRACSRSQSRIHSRPVAAVAYAGASASRIHAKIRRDERISSASSRPDEVTEEDIQPLKEALEKSGVSKAAIEANLEDAVKYLFADSERKREEIEEKVEDSSSKRTSGYGYVDRRAEDKRRREKLDDYWMEKDSFSARPGGDDKQTQYEKRRVDDERARSERRRSAPKVNRDSATSYRTAPPSYHTVEPAHGPSIRVYHDDYAPSGNHEASNLHRSKSARESRKVTFEDELHQPVARPRASSGSRLEPLRHEQPSLYLDTRPHDEYSDIYDVLETKWEVDGRSESRRSSKNELRLSPRVSPVRVETPRRSSRHLSISDAETAGTRRVERSVSPSSSITRYIVKE